MADTTSANLSLLKQDLKELVKEPGKSPMPAYRSFAPSELDDLVAYLASLRGDL